MLFFIMGINYIIGLFSVIFFYSNSIKFVLDNFRYIERSLMKNFRMLPNDILSVVPNFVVFRES